MNDAAINQIHHGMRAEDMLSQLDRETPNYRRKVHTIGKTRSVYGSLKSGDHPGVVACWTDTMLNTNHLQGQNQKNGVASPEKR